MDTYTVSFFGHRQMDQWLVIERRLESIIRQLLKEKAFVEFLVGRDGDFDQLVSSTIRRAKRAVGGENSALVWVMPYPTAEYRNHELDYAKYYDEIMVCPDSAGVHFKAAHQTRNRWMIDRSDLVVCYVAHSSGGASQALQYARSQGKGVVNLLN